MAKYLVIYDLIGTDETSEDYERLIGEIEKYPRFLKIQYSAWVVEIQWGAKQIFDDLASAMDETDRLLVVQLDGDGWWGRGKSKQETDDLATFIRS